MAIIIAIIAAVIVIAALITFNVRNASPGPEKQEATDRIAPPEEEKNEAQYPAEARAAEHTPSVVKSDSPKEKRDTMGDDIYRQALQSLSILMQIRQKKRSLRKVTKCRTAAIVMHCSP